MNQPWSDFLTSPLKGRIAKPRRTGITMIIDKGLSIHETSALFDIAAPYLDFLKLTFGTTVFYQPQILKQKVSLAEQNQIFLYPGGTFFEIAFWQGKTDLYFETLVQFGFKWVEISDGTLTIENGKRQKLITQAISYDLQVITEVGKKDAHDQPEIEYLVEQARSDLEMGAQWVIIEGRESGQRIGIFDRSGCILETKVSAISERLPSHQIIWEAPLKNQQAELITDFGPNVNLGNIPPSEALALEALRNGFRADTWKTCLK